MKGLGVDWARSGMQAGATTSKRWCAQKVTSKAGCLGHSLFAPSFAQHEPRVHHVRQNVTPHRLGRRTTARWALSKPRQRRKGGMGACLKGW